VRSPADPRACLRSRVPRPHTCLTDQGTRLGNTGLDFKENADRTAATLALSGPGMREDEVCFIGTMAVAN